MSDDINLDGQGLTPEMLNTGRIPVGPISPATHHGICDFGIHAVEQARNPTVTFVEMTQIRARLSCPGCIAAFDLEIKLKTTLATAVVEAPPPDLQQRISAELDRIDLSGIDITDL